MTLKKGKTAKKNLEFRVERATGKKKKTDMKETGQERQKSGEQWRINQWKADQREG